MYCGRGITRGKGVESGVGSGWGGCRRRSTGFAGVQRINASGNNNTTSITPATNKIPVRQVSNVFMGFSWAKQREPGEPEGTASVTPLAHLSQSPSQTGQEFQISVPLFSGGDFVETDLSVCSCEFDCIKSVASPV
jgi:hypothetical protein